jgi:hypothetical protein
MLPAWSWFNGRPRDQFLVPIQINRPRDEFGADDEPRFAGIADAMDSESRTKACVIFLPSPKMPAGRPRSRVA